MDFFDVVKLVLKWRYITVPLLALTFVLAVVASGRIQPEFTAQGSLILVGPAGLTTVNADGEASISNPLLSQSGALPTSAYVVALAASTPQVATILAQEGLSTSYDVAAQDRIPIILLETRAPTRESAANTALRLVELIEEDLRLRQEAADVPADQRVTADVVAISAAGGGDYGGRTRLRIIIVLFGLLGTVGTAFVLEALQTHRRRDSSAVPDVVDGSSAEGSGGRPRMILAPPSDQGDDRQSDDLQSSGR